MADKKENRSAGRSLIDTKYGTVAADSIETKTDKSGGEYVVGKLVTGADKEFDVYARGKNIDILKANAESGEPMFVIGELLAKGKAISAASFSPKAYKMTVESIGKEGENDYGAYASVKMMPEGKDRAWNVLVTGDDVAKAKDNVGKEAEFDLVWTAGQREDKSWSSSAISANSLQRTPAPKAETEGPSM